MLPICLRPTVGQYIYILLVGASLVIIVTPVPASQDIGPYQILIRIYLDIRQFQIFDPNISGYSFNCDGILGRQLDGQLC